MDAWANREVRDMKIWQKMFGRGWKIINSTDQAVPKDQGSDLEMVILEHEGKVWVPRSIRLRGLLKCRTCALGIPIDQITFRTRKTQHWHVKCAECETAIQINAVGKRDLVMISAIPLTDTGRGHPIEFTVTDVS